jgi:hypothetical protein
VLLVIDRDLWLLTSSGWSQTSALIFKKQRKTSRKKLQEDPINLSASVFSLNFRGKNGELFKN